MPLLMVQGDLDMSTPFENALEQLATSSNAHLIRVNGGTHAAIHQVYQQDTGFMKHLLSFLDADFGKQTVASLGLPEEIALPPIEFAPMSTESK